MLYEKKIVKIAILLISLAVVFSFGAGVLPAAFFESGGVGITFPYEEKLFGSSILSVNFVIDPEDWENMLANAISEEYYACDVEIDGTTFYRVGLRPKGNTSLSSIVSDPTTDRYSFKLEFDHYIVDQTCYGLDKLILNNNYADATSMKEALVYDMFAFLGADASLYNYARVSVNGEYWGVYLALEAVEESFLLRNYGTDTGKLYKPDGMNMGGRGGFGGGNKLGNFGENNAGRENLAAAGGAALRRENAQKQKTENGGFGAGFGGFASDGGSVSDGRSASGGRFASGGAVLEYTDDSLESYQTIWDGAVNDSDDSDHARVVAALKNAAEGTDLARSLDMDNLLKYMAVHIFSENADSLSGNMAHNYYLYEKGGILNLLPWDYNLAFGGMGMGADASDTVNGAVDNAFSATSFFDVIYENEEYLARYHTYLRRLCEEYVGGGAFEETYRRLRAMIDEPTASDPTAFYSAEEYTAAAEMLYRLVELRAESVLGQLDGTIPSTDEGQRADSSNLIDASEIRMNILGSMNRGGFGENVGNTERGGRFGFGNGEIPSFANGQQPPDRSENADGSGENGETTSENSEIPSFGNGQLPELPENAEMPFANGETPFGNGGFPPFGGGGNFPGREEAAAEDGGSDALAVYGISLAVIAGGLIFAGLFRRKGRR